MSESATPAASGAVTPVTAVDDGDDPVAAVAAAEALKAQETPETLGSGLAKSVGLAFSAPTANLQGVFQLVFDVVQKQQVVIGSIREEMSAMQEEYPHRLTALEDEILDLRLKLEDANLRMDGLKGGTPAPAPAKYSVFVGNLPLDVDANDTASLLDSATFDDAMAASVEPPKSCDKWGAAHQIMHFDSVDTATSVAETLDGSEMASAPGNSAAAKVAMAVVLGVEPESRYERQILVRHVRDELAHNEVLAVVDEYIPEPEPSELDRYGLRLIRFPSRVEALKAASALTGLVVGRSRLEAAVVSAVDEGARLHEALHDLVPTDPDTRHRTLVVSSCAIGEEISGYTLGKEFEDVESSDLRPTENGQFNVGRVVFKTDAACEKARAKLEGLRLGGCSVAGLAIELPETEVLARRLSLVEALDEELLKPHVEDATRRLEKIEERNAGEHELLLLAAMHVLQRMRATGLVVRGHLRRAPLSLLAELHLLADEPRAARQCHALVQAPSGRDQYLDAHRAGPARGTHSLKLGLHSSRRSRGGAWLQDHLAHGPWPQFQGEAALGFLHPFETVARLQRLLGWSRVARPERV